MWDKTLKLIDHQTTPQKAAALWDADENTLKLVSDGINLVYRFESKGQGQYLRITHTSLRNHIDLSSALDYQHYLFQHGAPICEALLSKQGHYYEEVMQDEMSFLVHVNREVPGRIMTLDVSDNPVYYAWGKALAQLHQAAKHYHPEKQYRFGTWRDLWEDIRQYAETEDIIIRQEFNAVDTWVNKLKQTPDEFGLTHADHRMGNVLVNDQEVHIIDFDEPVYQWYAADVARAFLELSQQKKMVWHDRLSAFIQGYRSVLPFPDQKVRELPWFARMKNLDMYLWTKNNWHDAVAPGGGSTANWLNEMRASILEPLIAW
jgi:Ser/Thr protein kinase RdoA (MazF antagonist)